jgi:hypothetical protein
MLRLSTRTTAGSARTASSSASKRAVPAPREESPVPALSHATALLTDGGTIAPGSARGRDGHQARVTLSMKQP